MIITTILQQLKDFYWITDSSKDTELTLSIKKSFVKLECVLWCNVCKTDQNGTDIIHKVEFDWCLLCYPCPEIVTCIPNITEIVTYDWWTNISWITFSWNKIRLPQKCSCSCEKCKKIEITFKWWLTQLDSCLLTFFTDEYEQCKEWWLRIKKTVDWDVTREYFDDWYSNQLIKDIKAKYWKTLDIFYCPWH